MVPVEVEEVRSALRCRDSREWLLLCTRDRKPRWPLCCGLAAAAEAAAEAAAGVTAPFGGGACLGIEEELSEEAALGKEAGFAGADLGKVLDDLPVEDFLLTGGGSGPQESGRCALIGSEEELEGILAALWTALLGEGPPGVAVVLDVGDPAFEGRGVLEASARLGAELEEVGAGFVFGAEEEATLPLLLPAALPPLTVACRILLFSSRTILSRSSRHCLSLACRSLS